MPTSAGALGAALNRIAGSAAFAYTSLALIQTRVMWGVWSHRDLSAGDSTSYFVFASRWAEGFELEYLYSPLHNVLHGSLLWVVSDAYAAMIAQRLVIALAVTLLVCFTLRRLLTPGIAWMLAAWWAVLPVNYDTVTELHLFAVIPVLAATALAASRSDRTMRATVLCILLGSAVVVRNELLLAALLWALLWAVYERRTGGWDAGLAKAFAWAAAVAGALAVISFAASDDRDLTGDIAEKNATVLCQHYGVGWQQRHGDLSQTAWANCEDYMRRDFGEPLPSLAEALAENPGAIARQYAWNAELSPYGLQLALFGATSGGERHNPDYVAVDTDSTAVTAGSVALLAILATGLTLLWRDRSIWWATWLRERAWGWAVLACVGAMGLYTLIAIRPRPAYLFALTFALLALTGMAAMAIVRRRPGLVRLRAGIPVLALVALIALPSHYDEGYATPQLTSGRPLKAAVDRLDPHAERFRDRHTRLLASYAGEICAYVGRQDPCRGVALSELSFRPAGVPAAAWLEDRGIDLLYFGAEDDPGGHLMREVPFLEAAGWRILEKGDGESRWALLARPAGGR